MTGPNPDLIQNPPDVVWIQPPPLVLFHDGGGTVFSYHLLGDVRRPVYGISNPHYNTQNAFEGGMPEMARHYVELIRKVIPSGKIILGGWSLGGLTSLEVARILAEDAELTVIGIIMIDSVCPLAYLRPSASQLNIIPHALEWNSNTRKETKEAISRCFSEAMKMVKVWEMPTWGDEDKGDDTGNGTGNEGGDSGKGTSPPLRPPPVILLRAKEAIPMTEDGVARVDVCRGDKLLGWGDYRADLITQVIDIPGHHFNIFHGEWRHDIITERIKRACLDFDRLLRAR